MNSASPAQTTEQLRNLSSEQVTAIKSQYGTPVYAYSEAVLMRQAKSALAFPVPYGLTVRYAMKANPLAGILRIFRDLGLHIDASSGAEVHRALKAGFKPSDIMLTSQQLPPDLKKLVSSGVRFNATSLHQLESFGRLFPGAGLAVRFNVGIGSGHTRSVSVSGPTSSFGIWHEQTGDVQRLLERYDLQLITIHSHIGCGSDPDIWKQAARKTLSLVEVFPTVTRLNLGGGFKVARLATEQSTDLQAVGQDISQMLKTFAHQTGRSLHLEIEPGTMLVANSGTLLATVHDIVSTGPSGYTFLKLDTGMNDIIRPALHRSQHPIVILNHAEKLKEYVVVGHNCESTDLLTPSSSDAEVPSPRVLPETTIGDVAAIEGVGAYCSAMSLVGYNSFARPNEVLVTTSGNIRLINRSQNFEDFTASEVYEG